MSTLETEASSAASSRLMVLLFSDIVGSTSLTAKLGSLAYSGLLACHDRLFKKIMAAVPGAEILKDTGDGYFASFTSAADAARTALLFQLALSREPWPGEPLQVRIGIHIGEVRELEHETTGRPKVVGMAADLAARVMSVAQGRQILMTRAAFNEARQFIDKHPVIGPETSAAAEIPAIRWVAHGPYLFVDADETLELFEVGAEGIAPLSAPPDTSKVRRSISPDEEAMLGWRPAVGQAIPGRTGWVLDRRLGEGGFGEVWLARHQRLHQNRVFKFCFEADRLRSLKRELTLFRMLREALGERKDIARLYDVKLDTPPYLLESEFTEGGNLSDWAAARGGISRLPMDARRELVARIADAVAAAHSVGVLHKDIKPGNILIREESGEPFPVISDFGISAVTDRARLAAAHVTVTGFTRLTEESTSQTGTRMYTPPEVLSGRPFTVHGDIYALGVLLFQMAVGDLGRPLAVGWQRDVTDELLREDIAACADGEPSRRLDSAAALADRLRNYDQRRKALLLAAAELRSAQRRRQAFKALLLVTASLLFMAIASAFGYLREHRLRQAIAGAEARARREQLLAEENARLAQAEHREAELRLGRGLVSQGDTLRLNGRLAEARRLYLESIASFDRADAPALLAHLALWEAARSSPAPALTRRLCDCPVTSISLSRDGSTIAAGADDGRIRILDGVTGAVLRTIADDGDGHALVAGSLRVAVSPDGRQLLSGHADGAMRLWDLTTGRKLRRMAGHGSGVSSLAFSSDGRQAISSGKDNLIRLWDLASGEPRAVLRGHSARGWFEADVVSVAANPAGQLIVSSGIDGTVRLWDASSGKELRQFRGHSGIVTSVAISPDARTVLTGGRDATLRLWSAADGSELHCLLGHSGAISAVDYLPGGKSAISAGTDGTVRAWDIASGRQLALLAAHEGAAPGLAASADGSVVVSCGQDGTLRWWDLVAGREEREFAPPLGKAMKPEVCARVALCPDRLLGAVSRGTQVVLLDLEDGRELEVLEGHVDAIAAMAMSPNGRLLMTAGDIGSVHLWDLATGRSVFQTMGHFGAIRDVSFSPDGRQALSAGSDKILRLWDLNTCAAVASLLGHSKGLRAVCFSADGRTALSTSLDNTVKHWNLAERKLVATFDAHQATPGFALFCAGGTRALSGGTDRLLFLWNLADCSQVQRYSGHEQWVTSACLTPGERFVLSTSLDSTLRVWEAATGRELRSLRNGGCGFVQVAFAADGQRLLWSGLDGRICYWDLSRPQRQQEFEQQIIQAGIRLQQNPQDGATLAVIGSWHGFRGQHARAAAFYERARAAGTPVSPVELARCYWLSGRTGEAQNELRRAQAAEPTGSAYAAVLLRFLERQSGRNPSPQPQAR